MMACVVVGGFMAWEFSDFSPLGGEYGQLLYYVSYQQGLW